MVASTASSASRLLWMSESSPRLGPPPGSGVDAFVGVGEQDAQRGGHRDRHEEPEDAPEIAAYDEREDDEHRAQGNSVTKRLGRDEVVDDARDNEIDHGHQDHRPQGPESE